MQIYEIPKPDKDNTILNYNLLVKHFNKDLNKDPEMTHFQALYFKFWGDSYKLFRTELEKEYIIDSEDMHSSWCISYIRWTFHKIPRVGPN